MKNLKFTLDNGTATPAPVAKAAPAVQKAKDFELAGNGKFNGGHFHVTVKPASLCEFNFKMMKTPKMSSNPTEQRVVIAYITNNGSVKEIGWLGEKIQADSQWHDIKHTVRIPDDSNGVLRIYVYNCHATGKISLKDFTYQCK